MPARSSSGSPYLVLGVFLAVALLSTGTLGWLVWQLLQQDAKLELQRRHERLEGAADRAATGMQRALLEFQTLPGSDPAPDQVPPGVSLLSIAHGRVTASPPGSLLYLPRSAVIRADAPAGILAEGERLEFTDQKQDLRGALKEYSRHVRAADRRVRAAALAGVARVHRKRGHEAEALAAYERLGGIDGATVAGLPAGLLARTARASIYEASGDAAALQAEAAALQHDLAAGTWPLVKSEYEFYLGEAHRWQGTAPAEDQDAHARAEALDWLWEHRLSLEGSSRRALALASGPALAAWISGNGELRAALGGPQHLAAMSTAVVPAGFLATLTDAEGRVLLGPSPQARQVAVRTGPAVGLPWTVHLAAAPGQEAVGTTSRRQLLLLVFATVAVVMIAGGYFILRAIARELRVARVQSDFVAAVSHEFRSPLTALAQIAQMLASDRFRSEADRRSSYQVLVSETERLRGLVEGLLDFGRFERGAEFRFERVDLPALVRGTVAEFQERVARNGYVVELSCAASELPPIEADREALSRALWNLLDNAVKYSPGCRTVWVDLECDLGRLRLSVRDRGLGIPAEEQPRIFDRFVRGSESTARRIAGTGIGLAMVRQIVQAHGGAIRVDSAPGQGSCFTIELKTPPHAPRRARPRARPAPDATTALASGRPRADSENPEVGGSEREVVP